jgi:hypothetical protein
LLAANPGTPSRAAANPPACMPSIPGFRLSTTAHIPQPNAITLIPQPPPLLVVSEKEMGKILNEFDVLFPNLDPIVRSSVMKDLEAVRFFIFSIFFFFLIETFR